jgi:hypothetical protein
MKRRVLWNIFLASFMMITIAGCTSSEQAQQAPVEPDAAASPDRPPPNLDVEPEGGTLSDDEVGGDEAPPPIVTDSGPEGGGEAPPPIVTDSDPEGGDEGPPPIVTDSDSDGGGEGPPPEVEEGSEPEASKRKKVLWIFGTTEGKMGPTAYPTPGSPPQLNERVAGYTISKFQGWETGHPQAIKSYTLSVESVCGGVKKIHEIKVTRQGSTVSWELGGAPMVPRVPVVHPDQLPCEFFGPIVGSIQATPPSGAAFTAEKARIKWQQTQ